MNVPLFLARCAAVFILLHIAYSSSLGAPFERWWIEQATVKTSASLINFIAPHESVSAEHESLLGHNLRLSVRNGCEGTDVLFLLLAAVLAFPASWHARMLGAAIGVTMVFLLNQARIAALYFALRNDRNFFDLLHGYLAPAIIVLAAALFFIAWTAWCIPNATANSANVSGQA